MDILGLSDGATVTEAAFVGTITDQASAPLAKMTQAFSELAGRHAIS